MVLENKLINILIKMKLQIKKSKTFSDKTGSLLPFYKNDTFKNFKLERFFFVYGKKKYFRADHAHKKCKQILIPIRGLIQVDVTTVKKKTKKFLLSHKKNNYLTVPAKHWIRLKFKDSDGIMLILCDYKYDKKEYIQKISEFYNQ